MATKVLAKQDLVINAAEGLDVCIWKLMADGKRRSATEIGDELFAKGVDRVAAKDRSVALMKRGWFKRIEEAQNNYYQLKPSVKMPVFAKNEAPTPAGKSISIHAFLDEFAKYRDPAKARKIEIAFDQFVDIALHILFKTTNTVYEGLPYIVVDSTLSHPQVFGKSNVTRFLDRVADLVTSGEAFIKGDNTIMTKRFFDRMEQYLDLIKSDLNPSPPPVKEEKQMSKKTATKVIQPDDAHKPDPQEGLAVCIWRVMSDYKQYSPSDVALLLEEVGIKKGTTIAKMAELVKANWFERDTSKEKGKRTAVTYKLKRATKKPENQKPYVAKEIKAKSNAEMFAGAFFTDAGLAKATEALRTTMQASVPYDANTLTAILHDLFGKIESPFTLLHQLTDHKVLALKLKDDKSSYTIVPPKDADLNVVITGGRREEDRIAAELAQSKESDHHTSRPTPRPGWEPAPPPDHEAEIKLEVGEGDVRPTFSQATKAVGSSGVLMSPEYTGDVKDAGEFKKEEIAPPLFEYSIKIAGQDFSFTEISELTSWMITHGYFSSALGRKASLEKRIGFIENTIMIKGQPLTDEDLFRLADEMVMLGIAVRQR